MSKFLRWNFITFITLNIWTIVFIFIVLLTIFWLICPLAFFRWFMWNLRDREEDWRIRYLKEAEHMLGCSDLLSRLSIEMNTIWEPISKKAWKKKLQYELKQKFVQNSNEVDEDIRFINPKNLLYLSIRIHGAKNIGVCVEKCF